MTRRWPTHRVRWFAVGSAKGQMQPQPQPATDHSVSRASPQAASLFARCRRLAKFPLRSSGIAFAPNVGKWHLSIFPTLEAVAGTDLPQSILCIYSITGSWPGRAVLHCSPNATEASGRPENTVDTLNWQSKVVNGALFSISAGAQSSSSILSDDMALCTAGYPADSCK
jgi:hypothetical protein